ncbi:MAG TPA: LacI family DNA-binding transcriptional regulator [Dictyobacter sp.]|jgi:LacI family transcriptional regulator|nr:LacI family DNA-binding transcriptional regulator [Dictyobacter sp.]
MNFIDGSSERASYNGVDVYLFDKKKEILPVIGSVTVKDVARKADVSVGTVSRVFNNHSNVTADIRQRVLQAATELGYARKVSQEPPRNGSRSVKEIGFLYCSRLDGGAATNNPFWSHILYGVEREARKFNIKVTYQAIRDLVRTPLLLVSTIQDLKLGGILLVGPADFEVIQILKHLNIPLVLIDNHVPGSAVDSVLCDNFEGASIAVRHLISQGHRRIAFIGGPVWPDSVQPVNKIYSIERRAAAYRAALFDAGLPIDNELFASSDLSTEGSYKACQRLLACNVPFSALFCANDETAIGAMKALREAGRRVPEDVSIVGFDDIALVEHLTPALTTVRVNKEALGAVAVRSLLARADDPQTIAVSHVLDVALMKRESVASYYEE